MNPEKFFVKYPIPSTSADSPKFNPNYSKSNNLLWRGPTWPILTWFVMEGLERH